VTAPESSADDATLHTGHSSSAALRRPIPALIASLAVAVAYLLVGLLEVFASTLYNWASSHFAEGFGESASSSFLVVGQVRPVAIALLIVTFLFFWGALPLHEGLRLGQAIGRGVVTAVVAGLVTGVVVGIQYLAIVRNLSSGAGQVLGAGSVRSLAEAADSSVSYFVQTAPLVVLGAVILWAWQRSNPANRVATLVGVDAGTSV